MLNLQHNVVNLLYTVKGFIESHFEKAENSRFQSKEHRIFHAEQTLKKVHHRTDQALQITRRIGREMKRTSKRTPCRSLVSLKYAWKDVMRYIRTDLRMHNIEIIERIPKNFPIVRCERDDFKEILYHLMKNAIQAMSKGGRMIIRSQVTYSDKNRPSASIILADTGPGIPRDELTHLFEPFFTTKIQQEGNGLGLYLTHELVERNQGRISVSSFQGHGSSFTLELPLHHAA